MPVENTDLERRVLAHEQILQALMAQLEAGEPGFLDQMRGRFAGARRGAHEYDYTETADYAEAFLHEVMRLVRVSAARVAAAPKPTAPAAAPAAEPPVVIRCARRGNVWQVTRDGEFVGDYLEPAAAERAADTAAHEAEGQGRRARVVFETATGPS